MRQLTRAIWPLIIEIEAKDFEIDDWCALNIGKKFDNWFSYGSGPDRKTFAFKKEEDIIIFKLRWNHGN